MSFDITTGPVLNVGKTLAGISSDRPYGPTEDIKERAKKIGLLSILNLQEDRGLNHHQMTEKLDALVWELAANVKKRITKYSDNDIINSLNFLEVFCLYTAQIHALRLTLYDDLESHKIVIKTIKLIEKLNQSVESNMRKTGKAALKIQVNTLVTRIDKIFSTKLLQTEQLAFQKVVNKAKDILKDI